VIESKSAPTNNEARGVAAVGKNAAGKNVADSGAAVGEGRRVLTVYPLFL
jgi:hypothetical protein